MIEVGHYVYLYGDPHCLGIVDALPTRNKAIVTWYWNWSPCSCTTGTIHIDHLVKI